MYLVFPDVNNVFGICAVLSKMKLWTSRRHQLPVLKSVRYTIG